MVVASDRCLDLYEMDNMMKTFEICKNLETGKFRNPKTFISENEDSIVFTPDYSTIHVYRNIISRDSEGELQNNWKKIQKINLSISLNHIEMTTNFEFMVVATTRGFLSIRRLNYGTN